MIPRHFGDYDNGRYRRLNDTTEVGAARGRLAARRKETREVKTKTRSDGWRRRKNTAWDAADRYKCGGAQLEDRE